MLHTKHIGRIALALLIVIFSCVILAANTAPARHKAAANLPLINSPDT